MLEGRTGPIEPGEITETQIRVHKGLTRERFKSEKTKSLRFIKRGLIIARFAEFCDEQPEAWYILRTGYGDPKLVRFLNDLKRSWPWNITTCNWTPGKILMSLREQSWAEFQKQHKLTIREPHLRILKLSTEEAHVINRKFAAAYKRAINKLGAENEASTSHHR